MEKSKMKRLLLLASLVAASYANASGDYGPSYMRYKAYCAPDTAIERFQQGQLGVLQPGMQRVYLYTAWRAMTLAGNGQFTPGLAGGLARANGSAFGHGWEEGSAGTASKEEWLREARMAESAFGICPTPSNNFALATLKAIGKRKDGTPQRIKAWTDAQELVAAACQAAEDARYMNKDALQKVVTPPQLAKTEVAYWRQLREYQRAAIEFHAERYADATVQFMHIGASADHPMRDLGAYLALRSEARSAIKQHYLADEAQRQRTYLVLQRRGAAILADVSLAARHEATRALLRSARASLLPEASFAELNKYLADPSADPFANDRLGDWAVVIAHNGHNEKDAAARAAATTAARGQYDFLDWIENLRECGYPGDKDKSCRASARRALEQWQRTKSRAWLTASMMTSATLTPALEKAAMAVKPADPEYLTLAYHLTRLLRIAGRPGQARAVSDTALKLPMSDGSRNLFREERFAVATSVADAAGYMLRVDVDMSRGSDKPVHGLNDDALAWLLHGLAAADMVTLARQPVLDSTIRARLASAAWMRADLLGKPDVALQALAVLEPLAPALKKEIGEYRRMQSTAQRRHLMVLTALRFGLSPQMNESSSPIAAIPNDEVTASNWCSFKAGVAGARDSSSFVWQLPPAPALGDIDSAKAELVTLATLKTSTGFVGEHVLKRVKAGTADVDLPWLLHVVVSSTRGGCLDPDAKQLSREAFNLLHKRFPRNEWTTKTPYFY